MKNDSINKGYPSHCYSCSLFLLWAFFPPDLQHGNPSEHNEIKQKCMPDLKTLIQFYELS